MTKVQKAEAEIADKTSNMTPREQVAYWQGYRDASAKAVEVLKGDNHG